MSIEAPVQVYKRLIVQVQGYDLRGADEYYKMFEREFAATCELYGLSGKVADANHDPKRFRTRWDVSTQGDGWAVDTRYMFLGWEDIIAADLIRPTWWKIVQMYRTIGVSVLNGALRHRLRASWRFTLFALHPLLLITAWILLGSFVGVLSKNLLAVLHAPELVANLVGAITGIGIFGSLLWLTEPVTGLLGRCDEAATTDELTNRKRKDIEKRLDGFASDLAEAVRNSDADEVVVVGHGFGAFLAVDVMGRALIRDPQLGEHGARVAMLTLGASLPVIGFDPEAKWFRSRLRQLAGESQIDWVDYQSRDDLMNFSPYDPIEGNDIFLEADERKNPQVVAVNFRDLWKPGNSGGRRLSVAKTHYQFLSANERPGAAYDYYLICCGPLDLATRATQPETAIAAGMGKNASQPGAGTKG
jgi:hypothetical protein